MNNFFMQKAINVAKTSKKDIPVGCIIVKNNKIIAGACNKKEIENCVTSHAEILALNCAARKINSWRLLDCDLYVTLEPCPMCAWAILNSRVKNIYFGAYDLKYGAFGGAINLLNFYDFKPKIFGGIMEEECEKMILDYFGKLR